MKKNETFWLISAITGAVFGGMLGGSVLTYNLVNRQQPRPAIQRVYKEKIKRVRLADITLNKKVELDVKDDLEAILKGTIPIHTLKLKPAKWKMMDSTQKEVPINHILKRSLKEGCSQAYFTKILDKAKKSLYDTNPSISSLELAVKTMKIPWKDFASASYIISSGPKGDSMKTMCEFKAEQIGTLKKVNGDCKDYTASLLTAYEGIKEMVKKGQSENPFYKKLFQGLLRYQMVGIYYPDKKGVNGETLGAHTMIATLTYNNSFLKVALKPLEPQTFELEGKSNYFFTQSKNRLLLIDSRLENVLNIHEITYFYNSQGIYKVKSK